MSKGTDLYAVKSDAGLEKETSKKKTALLSRLKKMLRLGKKSKKKDMEIYPLF
jgi:hypothetical protein